MNQGDNKGGERFTGKVAVTALTHHDIIFDPDAARASGKPIVLIVSGIHAGEIDGPRPPDRVLQEHHDGESGLREHQPQR